MAWYKELRELVTGHLAPFLFDPLSYKRASTYVGARKLMHHHSSAASQ